MNKSKFALSACLCFLVLAMLQGCQSRVPIDNNSLTETPVLRTTPTSNSSSALVTTISAATQTVDPLFMTLLQLEVKEEDHAILFSISPADGEWNDISLTTSDGVGLACITCVASASFAQQQSESVGFYSPEWSPDGNSYAFVFSSRTSNSILVRNNSTGIFSKLIGEEGAWYDGLSWAPDERYIAFAISHSLASSDKTSPVCYLSIDALSGEELQCNIQKAININPSWSLDGAQIIFASGGGLFRPGSEQMDLYIWDIENDVTTQFTDTPESELMAKWSPDGSRLALISRDNGTNVYTLYVANGDGSEKSPLLGLADVRDFDWSPDGKQIVYTELASAQNETCDMGCQYLMVLKIIDLDTGVITTLTDGTQWIGDPSWRP